MEISLIMTVGLAMASFVISHVSGFKSPVGRFSDLRYTDGIRKMEASKAASTMSFPPTSTPSPAPAQSQVVLSPRVYRVTSYGADPTGVSDSTDAILEAMSDAFDGASDGVLMEGIANLGGARVDLEGGSYLISRPLRFPATGAGNLMIQGGTLKASDDFPTGGHVIDLSSGHQTEDRNQTSIEDQLASSSSTYNYEYTTLRDLMVDSNYRGGGIAVVNSLRTTIDNCYIAHFATTGIVIRAGHETLVRNSFIGQHITAGADPGERNFSGTAINIMSNDNIVTDVVIFSAAIGVMVSGQANLISGVHCYNKATGFGGTGIYLKLAGLTQTRIVNSYLDYTGIVAEDPVQLLISNCFFLGDAYIVFKAINGVVKGVNVVDNMFSGSGKGIEIVQLDERERVFKEINQVIVDRNNVNGMKVRSTVAQESIQGNGTSWVVDFSKVLLFPNLISHVQYSLVVSDSSFPSHALRNVSENRVVIGSNIEASAVVFVTVDQSMASSS